MRFKRWDTALCSKQSWHSLHFPTVDLPDAETEGELAVVEAVAAQQQCRCRRVGATDCSSCSRCGHSLNCHHSISSGLMTTLPTPLSSQRRTCAVNVKRSFLHMRFLIEPYGGGIKGLLCANRHEVVEGSNDETAQTKACVPNKRRDVSGANDHLVVVTSMGVVSLHRFNLMEVHPSRTNSFIRTDGVVYTKVEIAQLPFLRHTILLLLLLLSLSLFLLLPPTSFIAVFLTHSRLSPKSLYFHPNHKTQHSSDAEGAISNNARPICMSPQCL